MHSFLMHNMTLKKILFSKPKLEQIFKPYNLPVDAKNLNVLKGILVGKTMKYLLDYAVKNQTNDREELFGVMKQFIHSMDAGRQVADQVAMQQRNAKLFTQTGRSTS